MKVRITQYYDPEIWEDTVKPHLSEREMWRTVIKENPVSKDASLSWSFDMTKADARRLAVMLEMVAGLGNPQTGLDMTPTKAELAA